MPTKSASDKRKVPLQLIGAAGVHFVVSELSLRGLIALPTARNTAGIDVLVSEPDGSALASLQVKTSLSKTKFWPTSRPEKCVRGPRVFYVFLRYLKAENRFEAFLESSEEVVKQVQRNQEDYERRGLKEFPYWELPRTPEGVEELRRRWETWRPPAS